LITALIAAEQSGDKLDQEETDRHDLCACCWRATRPPSNLIANGTWRFWKTPISYACSANNPAISKPPSRIPAFHQPVEHGVVRFAFGRSAVLGVTIPKGTTVMAMLSSANRDEAVFTDPDRLDITRDPNRHLAFGVGMHYCLGAPLARMEGAIAINAFAGALSEFAAGDFAQSGTLAAQHRELPRADGIAGALRLRQTVKL